MGQNFQFAIRQFSEAESTLTTVERINAPVPLEADLWKAPVGLPDKHATAAAGDAMGVTEEGKVAQAVSLPVTEANIASNWPAHGVVSFENVSVRYREGLPLVLRELTFTAQAGHRIGTEAMCYDTIKCYC